MAGQRNGFEGGTNATTITTGNSGGASGDAFSTIVGSPTYSSTRAASGAMSGRLPPASPGTSLSFNLSGTGTRWCRIYLWATAWTASTVFFDLSGANVLYYAEVRPTNVELRQAVGTSDSLLGTISVAPATSQWIRLEMQATSLATGAAELRLYNTADSTTVSGSTTGAKPQTADTWSYMDIVNDSSGSPPDVYVDEIAWSDVDWLGPVSAGSARRTVVQAGLSQAVHRAAVI